MIGKGIDRGFDCLVLSIAIRPVWNSAQIPDWIRVCSLAYRPLAQSGDSDASPLQGFSRSLSNLATGNESLCLHGNFSPAIY